MIIIAILYITYTMHRCHNSYLLSLSTVINLPLVSATYPPIITSSLIKISSFNTTLNLLYAQREYQDEGD